MFHPIILLLTTSLQIRNRTLEKDVVSVQELYILSQNADRQAQYLCQYP